MKMRTAKGFGGDRRLRLFHSPRKAAFQTYYENVHPKGFRGEHKAPEIAAI